jgi:hypothetical protein
LLTDRDKVSNLYRRPSITASYQAFSEEKMLNKSVNQKKELPVAAMSVNGSRQNMQSLETTAHSSFLPSFVSLGNMAATGNCFF